MARKVFFSFDYDRDIWRVSQIRNHKVTKDNYQEAGYIDSASWETVKKTSKENIKRWIDNNLNGTSVTVVLVGNQTYHSDWVNYEILESLRRGNGVFGIYIHNMQNQLKQIDIQGSNPFDRISYTTDRNNSYSIGHLFPIYDWVLNSGYVNFPNWVEQAYKDISKYQTYVKTLNSLY